MTIAMTATVAFYLWQIPISSSLAAEKQFLTLQNESLKLRLRGKARGTVELGCDKTTCAYWNGEKVLYTSK